MVTENSHFSLWLVSRAGEGKKDSYFKGQRAPGYAAVCFWGASQYVKSRGLRYFVAPLFSLAGGDRVQKWPKSSQLQYINSYQFCDIEFTWYHMKQSKCLLGKAGFLLRWQMCCPCALSPLCPWVFTCTSASAGNALFPFLAPVALTKADLHKLNSCMCSFPWK